MQRHPVHSSVLNSAGYDPARRILELEFKEGETWDYFNVSQSAYKKLITSDSIGRFFVKSIKGKYPELRIK